MNARYTIGHEGHSITCHTCGLTSHHPKDVEHRFCGHCGIFHDSMQAQWDELGRAKSRFRDSMRAYPWHSFLLAAALLYIATRLLLEWWRPGG